jgi:intraflagellar transport protein 20
MEEKPLAITFDEENRIRVLEADKFRESDQLKNTSMEFITKVLELGEAVGTLNTTLDGFSFKVEKEMLRALGERNKVEAEPENRKKKMLELNNLLNEKKSELERYTVELESLARVDQEQKTLIKRLTNNDV